MPPSSRAPTRTSSTCRRSSCSRVSDTEGASRAGSVDGTSSIRKRTTSSTRSTGRVTSFARQFGTVTWLPSTSKPSRTSRSRCSSSGKVIPVSRSASSGRSCTTGRGGSVPCTSTWPVKRAPARATSSSRRVDGRLLGGVGIHTLLPPDRRVACGGEAGVRCAAPSERRSSQPRGGRLSSPARTSLSSPPMIPATATGRLASAITRSVGASSRSWLSSVTIFSPGWARRTTIRPSASRERSKAWRGEPSASIT